MGFFKEFKEDLSQAVDELVPGDAGKEEMEAAANEEVVKDEEDARLQQLNAMLQQVEPQAAPALNKEAEVHAASTMKQAPTMEQPAKMVSDETAVITEGMTITGNLDSTGSVEVRGHVDGDVRCNGKLVVAGYIHGNTSSAEFFADNAKVEGEIIAEGTVKVGSGSVIIGNITATSAVIAGAIKGDIDVQGPVVVDTSAVVMGNIKSRSVQINNGAVIEGFCSQCYSEIDVQQLFK